MIASLNSAHAGAVLEKVASSRLVQDGCVVLLSLDAVRLAAGARWPAKQTAVYEYAEREFDKHFSTVDQFIRVSDSAYLLVQPHHPHSGGLGRGLRLLRDILEFFLGRASPEDLRIGIVTQLEGSLIQHRPLGGQQDFGADIGEARSWAATDAPSPPPSVPINKTSARKLLLDFKFHAVWSRKKNAIVSNRLKPAVYESLESGERRPLTRLLGVREQTGVDLMVLDEALSQLGIEQGAKFGLHAPVHISTLNSAEGRQAVFARLAAANRENCSRLAICLAGLQDVPRVVLDPAVAALRPFVLGVVGQAPSLSFDASIWRGSRLAAVSLDLTKAADTAPLKLQKELERFTKRAESVSSDLILHGVISRTEAVLGWGAGFTELSGPFLGDNDEPCRPIRFASKDLYRANA